MPNLRAPRGVSATPKKKGGGMLSGMLGGGVTGGGFTPAFNADAAALDEFNGSGVDSTDEAASIDQYSQIRNQQIANGVQSTPAGFSPYQVQNPILDKIFNRGQSSNLATSLNAQQGVMQFQNEAAKAQQESIAKSAMEREVYGQGQTNERQMLANKAQEDLIRNQAIYTNLAKRNVSPLANPTQFDPAATTIANNQDTALINAQQQPWFRQEVAGNLRADLQKQGVNNAAQSRVVAQPNTRVFETSTNPENNGRLFEFPGTTEQEKLIPEIITLPNGQQIQTGKMIKSSTFSQTQGGYMDERQAQLEAKKKALMEAAARPLGSNSVSVQSNPAMSNTPQGFPVSATPSNTAMLPSAGRAISQGVSNAADYANPLRDDTAIVDIIRKLFNSNYKGSPVPQYNKP